ncbi:MULTISPECIES: FAD/NAD(P)-binding protein [Arthrobacter]|uniref:FAD/NAD(P)-binding protein n=2 Tax=Arthrobacter TaxID=1663 RepID=A0ABU9KHF1_9MICC|nr:FAD/NAD(P)-binding protein [Arthrobacter sp. YJM1]MDP5226670.1 FAD/NAD(P)-binding protein [Arthrobacter sp. YJM1]
MAGDAAQRVAVIGAGPRGSSVLERLAANWRARRDAGELSGARLELHLVDPYPPGSGHVWQPGQSRLFLMNTQSFFPTLIPEDPDLAPPVAGGTFNQWREAAVAGDQSHLGDGERAELAALAVDAFPSRAIYGRYLEDTVAAVVHRIATDPLLEGLTVHLHRTEAVAVRRREGTGFEVELRDGTLPADRVVLALGHVPALLNPEQRELHGAARELGLSYFPPACPADVDWAHVPEAEPVLIRGMGLNFFDVMGQLTEGRGGRFDTDDGGGLRYVPSGREPVIHAASRRGGPYHAKARIGSYYARTRRLRYLTETAVARFRRYGVQPGFGHDLQPLLQRDVLWAYYETLVLQDPNAVRDAAEFLDALAELLRPHAHAPEDWLGPVNALLEQRVPAALRLNLRALAAPFSGQRFGSPQELDDAVLATLDTDVRRSSAGESDPVKAAVLALHAGRSLLKDAVADGGITDESWVTELRGRFESLVEGLASGPPALRIEQLAALARAGVVRFLGPEPRFGVDRAEGLFRAASPWVDGGEVRARTMIEALAPANRVSAAASPLLRQLLEDGLVRTRLMMRPEGGPTETSGLDVAPHPYRAVAANGVVQEDLHVLSLQLSATQWGVAIAAEAFTEEGGERRELFRSGQRTLRDADEIARAVLDAL